MDTDGHGWTRMNTNGHGWTRMDTDGHGWTRMDTDGHGWTRMDTNGHEWTRMWTRMDTNEMALIAASRLDANEHVRHLTSHLPPPAVEHRSVALSLALLFPSALPLSSQRRS